jgi:hypothetical protein
MKKILLLIFLLNITFFPQENENIVLDELAVLMNNIEDFEQDIFVLKKRLHNEGAIGEYEIANSFSYELRIVKIQMYYYYHIYGMHKNRNCINNDEYQIIHNYLTEQIELNIKKLNVGLELDIRESLYSMGVKIRNKFREFRDLL